MTGPWWDPNDDGLCVWGAWQAEKADSLAHTYTDLSGNGRDLTVGNAPDWDATNGWKFNGTNDYLKTSFQPETDQTQSVIVKFSNHQNNGYLLGVMGAVTGDRAFSIRPDYDNGATDGVHYKNGDDAGAEPALLQGTLAVAGNKGYRNGSDDGVTIGGYSGSCAYDLWIGCYHYASYGAYYHGQAYIQAVAVYDCTLTAQQVADIHDAMLWLDAPPSPSLSPSSSESASPSPSEGP
jgi:hypothetical protein